MTSVSEISGVPADLDAGEDARRVPRWRQWLTWALAAIWLLDAHLQFQQFMFTAGKNGFPQSQIEPAGQGSPAFVHGPVDWAVRLMDSNIGLWNFLFASAQLAIGLALIWRRTVRLGLLASVAWALPLWWMGEGLGGIFAGPVSPLMGLPGAAVLYVLVAILVWPSAPRIRDMTSSVATTGLINAWVARGVWALLWLLSAWESLRTANRAPSALHDMVVGMESGEPHWLRSINAWGGTLIGSRGLAFSIGIAVVCVLIAVAPLLEEVSVAITRAGLVLAVAFALLVWVVAEDFGGIATGQATDPNTGPLLVLLALTMWPLGVATSKRVTHARTAPRAPVGTSAPGV